MAARGSGIGAMASLRLSGLGSGGGGGSQTSLRGANAGSIYGRRVGGAGFQTHHALWVLVALEIFALIAIRYSFRRYHGG